MVSFGGICSKMESVLVDINLSPIFGFKISTRFPDATNINESAVFGHHATHRTTSFILNVFVQRPVAISQTKKNITLNYTRITSNCSLTFDWEVLPDG